MIGGCKDIRSLSNPDIPTAENFIPLKNVPTRLVHSQIVYVPIYSSIQRQLDRLNHLASILSIRNISPDDSIIISRIEYYDTNGKLLKRFIEKPFKLDKMSSKDFLVPQVDISGGSGANFIVKWETDKKVPSPLIESVMIGNFGPQGFAFSSRGKEIEAKFGQK